MTLPSPPNLNGYILWIRNIMEVPQIVLPNNSPYIGLSYDLSLAIVNKYLDWVAPGVYTIAVYNLGGDFLVNNTQDNSTLSPPDNTYWSDLRSSLQINNFVPGFINSTADQGTSTGVKILSVFDNLTFADLQTLKTPWGRTYMGIAQSVGSMWGITF